MEMLGAPPEVLQSIRDVEAKDDIDFEVDPVNWKALDLFMTLRSDWSVVAHMGGAFYQGIPKPNIKSLFWLLNIKEKHRCKLFKQILLIERGALSVINEQS